MKYISSLILLVALSVSSCNKEHTELVKNFENPELSILEKFRPNNFNSNSYHVVLETSEEYGSKEKSRIDNILANSKTGISHCRFVVFKKNKTYIFAVGKDLSYEEAESILNYLKKKKGCQSCHASFVISKENYRVVLNNRSISEYLIFLNQNEVEF